MKIHPQCKKLGRQMLKHEDHIKQQAFHRIHNLWHMSSEQKKRKNIYIYLMRMSNTYGSEIQNCPYINKCHQLTVT